MRYEQLSPAAQAVAAQAIRDRLGALYGDDAVTSYIEGFIAKYGLPQGFMLREERGNVALVQLSGEFELCRFLVHMHNGNRYGVDKLYVMGGAAKVENNIVTVECAGDHAWEETQGFLQIAIDVALAYLNKIIRRDNEWRSRHERLMEYIEDTDLTFDGDGNPLDEVEGAGKVCQLPLG